MEPKKNHSHVNESAPRDEDLIPRKDVDDLQDRLFLHLSLLLKSFDDSSKSDLQDLYRKLMIRALLLFLISSLTLLGGTDFTQFLDSVCR